MGKNIIFVKKCNLKSKNNHIYIKKGKVKKQNFNAANEPKIAFMSVYWSVSVMTQKDSVFFYRLARKTPIKIVKLS